MQINGLLEKTSLIRMIDSAQTPVDSARIGEPSYSEDGSRSQILDIMVGREACGIQLSLINGTVLICTEGLPIQTSEGWKAAVSVKPGDSVGYQEKWGKAYIEVQEVRKINENIQVANVCLEDAVGIIANGIVAGAFNKVVEVDEKLMTPPPWGTW